MKASLIAGVVAIAGFMPAQFCAAFDTVPYVAPRKPKLIGVLAKNNKLRHVKLVAKGKIKGPEDLAFDESGRMYAGSTVNGKIYRITTDAKGVEHVDVFADPGGGMTLGLKFDRSGDLLVCNCPKGLLSVDPSGKITCLTNRCGDKAIVWADDLDVASDGKIYFSDASKAQPHHQGYETMFRDLLEGNPYGKLFVYDPETKTTQLLLDNLYFANGVTLSKEEDFVLVNETYRYRVRRFWLKGPKAGSNDILADNLPGMPDGITRDPNGDYWLSMVVPRSSYVDYVHARPRLKRMFSHLPRVLWGRMKHYGMVLRMNNSGEIVETLQDPSGRIWSVTNVVPWKNSLYLGTLRGNAIARYDRSPTDSSMTKSKSANGVHTKVTQ